MVNFTTLSNICIQQQKIINKSKPKDLLLQLCPLKSQDIYRHQEVPRIQSFNQTLHTYLIL